MNSPTNSHELHPRRLKPGEDKKDIFVCPQCSPRACSPYMQNIFNYKEVRQEGRVCLREEEAVKAALQLDTRTREITSLPWQWEGEEGSMRRRKSLQVLDDASLLYMHPWWCASAPPCDPQWSVWAQPRDSQSQNLHRWAVVSWQQQNANTNLRAITFLHYNNTSTSFAHPGPAAASSNGRKWMLMHTARMLRDSRRCKLWMHRIGAPAGDEVLFTGQE